jgi:hypothetical protein
MTGIAQAALSAPAAPSARAALAPPPAWQGQAANTDTIAIDPVVQVTDAGGGTSGQILSVTADSTTALTGMTVHLLDATTDQELLRLPMSAPVDPPVSGPSTWTSPVISQARLPLGGPHCTGWCYIAYPITDSTGRFSATFKDPESATWSAEFFGNSTHLATLAPLAYVPVG